MFEKWFNKRRADTNCENYTLTQFKKKHHGCCSLKSGDKIHQVSCIGRRPMFCPNPEAMSIVDPEIMEKIRSDADKKKKTAHSLVAKAIKSGDLVRKSCFCGKIGEAHHFDYDQPLKVVWLCRAHHAKHHGMKLRAEKQHKKYLSGIQNSFNY